MTHRELRDFVTGIFAGPIPGTHDGSLTIGMSALFPHANPYGTPVLEGTTYDVPFDGRQSSRIDAQCVAVDVSGLLCSCNRR